MSADRESVVEKIVRSMRQDDQTPGGPDLHCLRISKDDDLEWWVRALSAHVDLDELRRRLTIQQGRDVVWPPSRVR